MLYLNAAAGQGENAAEPTMNGDVEKSEEQELQEVSATSKCRMALAHKGN